MLPPLSNEVSHITESVGPTGQLTENNNTSYQLNSSVPASLSLHSTQISDEVKCIIYVLYLQ